MKKDFQDLEIERCKKEDFWNLPELFGNKKEADAVNFPSAFLEYSLEKVGDFRNVGVKIKNVRTAFGITQKQMALVLNISQPTYSEIEKEGNQILPKTLAPIAAFFNISFTYFYGFTNQFELFMGRNVFFKVNGYSLLDFITPKKIFEVMQKNNNEISYQELEKEIEIEELKKRLHQLED